MGVSMPKTPNFHGLIGVLEEHKMAVIWFI